ncbi:putative pentatricopeptide repeat-containing protein At1g68930 isoform X1 [Selaginella moellendorffii]|uniref:putative pentatricopeptide repeat-containing protein At1g68930 isoform X1 n=1 Tax=Selaginella moellendorffii TaxID=88036 RepID=UPI000D1D0235|nr:putative pentatricopeptide repeat-containing protein At1g68930 isoform X1 [Selaginella moellendorffii]|eukprot:XP_024541773.1 putative pentatricopeptide repeat-containing protein At1g68930 isoform X1 [Selaginella moellendorffii]
MQSQARRCQPDELAFVAAFKAVTGLAEKDNEQGNQDQLLGYLSRGMALHSEAQAVTDVQSSCLMGNALIVMYAKCGSMPDAQRVFDRMAAPDVFSWTSLVLGYVESGNGDKGLEVFAAMIQIQGITRLDVQTLATALKACGSCANLDSGKSIYALACRLYGLEAVDAVLANSLIDVFAKSGSIVHSQRLFDSLAVASRELVAWNSLMAGYARQGNSKLVISLFERMQREAVVKADATTFVCLLTACSHAGLVEEAREYLEGMSSKHGIAPGVDHYSVMVDALARANKMDAAVAMAESMPVEAASYYKESVAWRSVLGACCKWKNLVVGKLAFERLVELNDQDAAAYVLMDNVTGGRGA